MNQVINQSHASQSIELMMTTLGIQARAASRTLAGATTQQKNAALHAIYN